MILVALVINMFEGEMLFVVCQLRRGVIGCNDCKKLFLLFDSSIVSGKSVGLLLVKLVTLYSVCLFC